MRAPQLGRKGNAGGADVLKRTEGTVSANRAGYGFVRSEDLPESVFLPPGEMRGLMHGDRVRIAVRGDSQGRYLGEVLEVLERGVQAFLGVVEGPEHRLAVRAADARLGFVCRVVSNEPQAAHGDWVIARLLRYPGDSEPGQARIERLLDPQRPVEMASEAAIARFALPVEFSREALLEAQRYGGSVDPHEAARRIDLREMPLVTIDGEDAKDFDDAVHAESLPGGGFRLRVAIADVSHYVQPGSALDREARERGTSVYFPTRVLPMLPVALSNHLCSLEPQVDRLCMVADMQLSRRGALEESRFYPAVMRSAARLTYTLAHEALFLGVPAAREQLGAPLLEALLPLVQVYRLLAAARRRRGALDFDAPEARFVFDASAQQVHSVRFATRNDAHRLIEECMILANVAVAQELRRRRVPALLRVHAPPDEKKLEQLRATLRVLGIELMLSDPVHARDLGAVAPKVRDPEARPFIESLVVRSLAQALYQSENLGHFGLALKDYAHFTSPIRRYPDLMIHRALRVAIGAAAADSLSSGEELAAAGAELSRLERRADEAARFVSTFLKCVYLRDRIGQTFQGLVTTVMEFGCFVQLLEVGADGLLPLTALRDDEYQMARDGGQWIGARTGRRLAPGVRLRVTVAAVKPVEGQIDLELASDAGDTAG
ncbi:MAG TPA: ribonuclease R [Steroidobacteraceae bacterium]|jgi:ribonuclease R|nr:ribonuclease R [Steroidobacteraceae bacterium]